MVMLLDIEENKVPFVMEWLNKFSFVKTQPVSEKKAFLLRETKERVDTTTEMMNLTRKKVVENDPFAEVRGIWADRNIDAKTLRKQAWGIEI
ncbi:MAG: hypothetical protein FWG84_08910 [Bacteroidales bacterium]|nr:hypothetical protein [Bacteroidales bacterium]